MELIRDRPNRKLGGKKRDVNHQVLCWPSGRSHQIASDRCKTMISLEENRAETCHEWGGGQERTQAVQKAGVCITTRLCFPAQRQHQVSRRITPFVLWSTSLTGESQPGLRRQEEHFIIQGEMRDTRACGYQEGGRLSFGELLLLSIGLDALRGWMPVGLT